MTPMWDAMLGEGEMRTKIIRSVEHGIPLGKFGEPIDVAYAAFYLASDESQYVTGIELNVDGGILAGSEARVENRDSLPANDKILERHAERREASPEVQKKNDFGQMDRINFR